MASDEDASPARICSHHVTFARGDIVLRPMSELDWGVLLRWNTDVDVLHYSDGPGVPPRSLTETQHIYRGVSRAAFCFIIEWRGRPVGECWLQQLNLDWLRQRHPDLDCRRIDITIGEQDVWGAGIGTTAVGLLRDFAFESQDADALFACDVADYNARSRRMFERLGFELFEERGEDPRRAYLVCRRSRQLDDLPA